MLPEEIDVQFDTVYRDSPIVRIGMTLIEAGRCSEVDGLKLMVIQLVQANQKLKSEFDRVIQSAADQMLMCTLPEIPRDIHPPPTRDQNLP